MKERPILFNAEMVRAILDGSKTQTRRPIKPQPELTEAGNLIYRTDKRSFAGSSSGLSNLAPFGQVGDLLWVPETWAVYQNDPDIGGLKDYSPVIYKATFDPALDFSGPWKPSIHMPRWASRITLEITDVRVERVQDITEEDARAEGMKPDDIFPPPRYGEEPPHKELFAELWSSIYGNWHQNPWVWVYEFERLEDRN